MDRVQGSRRETRALFAAALAVATAACVSVPDDIKATFAPPSPHETDNFALNAPHGRAPAEDPVTKPLVAGLDASAPMDAAAPAPVTEGMCPRDVTTTSSLDAALPVSSNCSDGGAR